MSKERITPVADIYETDSLYAITLEVPGVSREQVEITLDNNELEIIGKVAPAGDANVSENDKKQASYREYALADYHRTFTVGNDVDPNRIDAKMDQGILTIELHKRDELKPKKIEVSVH